ncbi:thioredoxin family protein [Thiorhodospira sibirica]|uniref:thioredoxin family protein n=1 Tax=Thiorhodospira sibirica TaxID=154347 RepID=UPI00022C111E|nr:thioredoxin family protein [Thiorhodospira sibirica]
MKQIKVLGSGCARCADTAKLIEATAERLGVAVQVVKETNPQALVTYRVMSTPAVVIDETLVHSGSMPKTEHIEGWLQS